MSFPRRAETDAVNTYRYWDVRIKPSTYSYLDAALAEGYSVFTYDRLGTGKSQKPNGYDAVQVAPQVEILRQLTLLARAGKLVTSSVSKPPGSSPSTKIFAAYKPKKIVHVGHSLGSITTIGLLNTDNGTLSDGAILTGFIYSNKGLGAGQLIPGWGFEYAKENDPVKFGDRSGGYIVQARPGNVQLQFVKKGTFEPALLDYAWQIRQPATVSEFLSISQVLGKKAAGFKGAVQVWFPPPNDPRHLSLGGILTDLVINSSSLGRTTSASAAAIARGRTTPTPSGATSTRLRPPSTFMRCPGRDTG